MEELLTKLDQGSVIRVPLGEESELRGLRLALGRRAAGRGFKVETRTDGQTLVVRKSDQPFTGKGQAQAAPAPTNGRKRGRPRKQEQESTAAGGLGTEGEGGDL